MLTDNVYDLIDNIRKIMDSKIKWVVNNVSIEILK